MLNVNQESYEYQNINFNTTSTYYSEYNKTFGFSTLIFLSGTVWVYGKFAPNVMEENLAKYCDQTAFYLSFCLITLTYVAIVFTGLFFLYFVFFCVKPLK